MNKFEPKKFDSLLQYYIECVKIDQEYSVIEEAVSSTERKYKHYVKLTTDEFAKFEKKENFDGTVKKRIIEELGVGLNKTQNLEYLIGYPILHNKTTNKIIPAFLFPVAFTNNLGTIEYYAVHNNARFSEELSSYLDDKKLNPLNRIIFDFVDVHSTKDYNLAINKQLKNLDLFLSDENEKSVFQLYPDYACFFITEKKNFTINLEKDLLALISELKISDRFYLNSSLSYLFSHNTREKKVLKPRPFTQLNDSQMHALNLSINSGLTNIQGPPGTGKSDVVLNVILNAYINNKSILFSSKNHQAIKTVFERLEKYLPGEILMLKMNDVDGGVSALIDRLSEILNNRVEFTFKDEMKMVELVSQSNDLLKKIEVLSANINRINRMRQRVGRKYDKINLSSSPKKLILFNKIKSTKNVKKVFLLNKNVRQIVTYQIQSNLASKEGRCEEFSEELVELNQELTKINKELLILVHKQKNSLFNEQDKYELKCFINQLKQFADSSLDKAGKKEMQSVFSHVLNKLKLWAVTNLSVSKLVSLDTGLFDYIIVDEASQCDIPSSLSLMVRTKHFIIVGDEKQLNHISTIKKDENIFRKYMQLTSENASWIYSNNSILDVISRRSKNTDGSTVALLNEHYRSRSEIIQFSIEKFYADELQVRTDYSKLNQVDEKPIVWEDTLGHYSIKKVKDGNKLYVQAEVEKCVELLIQLCGNSEIKSIGVITPFKIQSEKIQELFEKKKSSVKSDVEIKIDTIHKFQGDERDVMIFSLAVADEIEIDGKKKNNNEAFYINNPNLINVALTRAKSQLFIVGNYRFCFLSKSSLLKGYAKYYEKITEDNSNKPETKEEEVLFDKLKEIGLNPVTQYPFQFYRMDIAFVEKKICIEVDGWQHEGAFKNERNNYDANRDYAMIKQGWKVVRFWNYEVWHSLDKCVERILEVYNSN